MPAKSMCPNCGQGHRSPNHICIPSAAAKMDRRKAALKQVTGQK